MKKQLVALLLTLLPLGAQAHCIKAEPERAIILRDGGTILVDLMDGGRLRYDRRYGSPTRLQFFYEPQGKPERPLTQAELKCLSQQLSKQTVENGKEYYDNFVKDLNQRVKTSRK